MKSFPGRTGRNASSQRETKTEWAHSRSGFSLIELMIVIAITAIVGTATYASYRVIARGQALVRSANAIAADIRRAQNFALSAEAFDGTSTPQGGFGILFDTTNQIVRNYVLFADNDASQHYSSYQQDVSACIGECLDELRLEPGISYVTSGFTVNGSSSPTYQRVSAIFCPPYGTVLLYADNSSHGDPNVPCVGDQSSLRNSISIPMTDGRITRIVTLYATGAVDIQ